jgi:putative FmdB family regulatory protein
MPTYEYECTKCGHLFEEYQRITAEPLTTCPKPECGGTVRRLISAGVGVLFKGSGFYSTDYRSESYKQKSKADSGPSAAPTPPPAPSSSSSSESSSPSSAGAGSGPATKTP